MRGTVSRIGAVGVAVLLGSVAAAGSLDVSILERSGKGVADVVVTVDALAPHRTASAAGSAVMDQRNRAFLPRVLVVATGTLVEFPNNDTVSHQVYSFSDAKKFQLPLYKGERHSPVLFDRAGLVVLGCNIHDDMAGYIYVTDAQFFGETNADGVLHLQGVPSGDYRLTVWSPFIADTPTDLSRDVHLDTSGVAVQQIRLTRPLRALPEPRPRRSDWEY